MTTFIQAHFLTVYPPANLNRDDVGRPKTAIFGAVPRLRVSSQSLKRAWRTSDVFKNKLEGRLGSRTMRFGEQIEAHLQSKGASQEKAREIARAAAGLFGKVKPENDKNPVYIEQLAFLSSEEKELVLALAERAFLEQKPIDPKTAGVLRQTDSAVDIAMFGRMLASSPDFNREAAVQVAHAITTHRVLVEDDYYTAVDDLKRPSEDAGAAFVGEAGFGAGVFYLYLCIDRDLLERNLGGNQELANAGIAALLEAAATTAPKGKQASFASHARASYLMVERGDSTPRTLAGAFLSPIKSKDGEGDYMALSVVALEKHRNSFAKAYGDLTKFAVMNITTGEIALANAVAFAIAAT
ncbi:CRISPR system Cascade subunit CasC [Azospirillaceae bacterium]